MPARVHNFRKATSSLSVALSAGHTGSQSLTPASYTPFMAAGWTSGEGYVRVGNPASEATLEIVRVLDFAQRPWPIERAIDGTTALAHATGVEVCTIFAESAVSALLGVSARGHLEANAISLDVHGEGVQVRETGARPNQIAQVRLTQHPAARAAARIYASTTFS